MQSTALSKNTASFDSPNRYSQRIVILPRVHFQKIVDFLEDKWGTTVVRTKNEFYRANLKQGRPVARLLSKDTLIVSVIDRTTGTWHEIQTKIEDIELPKPLVIEQRIYRKLIFQLARASGGGVTRWINKFYCTATGKVQAELISNDKIRLFETDGLFGSSKVVSLEDYASIQVSPRDYFHLLSFLGQQIRGEVIRLGNEFYSKEEVSEFLAPIFRSPWSVSTNTMNFLRQKILAELLSNDAIRIPDDTSKKISDLILTKRALRIHMYFCNFCQSFLSSSYRTTMHHSESGTHKINYVSSSTTLVPISGTNPTRKMKDGGKKFPAVLYRFWGIERGRVPWENPRVRTKEKQSTRILDSIPIQRKVKEERSASTSLLLLSAEITIDGHRVTNEERLLAFERLKGGEEEETKSSEGIESQEKQSMDIIQPEEVNIIITKEAPKSHSRKEQKRNHRVIDELPELLV